MSQLIAQDAFKVIEGRPVTTSRIVAECFGKQHQHVMRDIRALIAQKPELEQSSNFGLLQETVQVGNGGTKKVTIYWMDRKGFSILAMGFTGAKALDFKCAFYDEFERMEKQLHPQCPAAEHIPPAYLTLEHQYAIQSEVAKRVHKDDVRYQTVYQALKARFRVPKYTCILDRDFEAAVHFIRTCNLRVPEVPEQKPEPQVKTYTVTETFLERVRSFVYYWRYLHRADLERFLCLMQSLNSPYAAQFAEAIKNLNLILLEGNLEQLGFPVKELPAYKALMSE